MSELTPMYRLKNILARNNSKKREALRCAFSMVIQVRDAVSALQTRAGLSASFSMANLRIFGLTGVKWALSSLAFL
jgi:hypothetical protein